MYRWCGILALLWLIAAAPRALAADIEGCLNCHQFEGLSRPGTTGKAVHSFSIDPDYYSRDLGPHARLKCSDCHPRGEVEVFPHKPITPVDCMRSCHLTSPNRAEATFSHKSVGTLLAGSVHKGATLRRSTQLLGAANAAGQSQCLACHAEPLFRLDDHTTEDASLQRCAACHDQDALGTTRAELHHVQARTVRPRTSLEVVQLCGTCHGNAAVNSAFNLPDSTASYLASFHGKAAMLGSQNTADCLHCHAGLGQNVHGMQKALDGASPTSLIRTPDTCRTAGCHETAGAHLSAAAVHLDVASTRGIEFIIACLFVAMVAFTFGPSLLLTALKLLHYILGRRAPHEAKHAQLARVLNAHPRAREKLVRFTPHQRAQHWLLAVTFTLLCLTGFPMKFADQHWAAWLIARIGGLSVARTIHHFAGVLLICGFFYHILYVILLARRAGRDLGVGFFKALSSQSMSVGLADLKHMNKLLEYYLFLRKDKPVNGKFSPEQKFEYLGVFWGVFVLGSTGLLLWATEWTSRQFPGRTLTLAALLHTFEAFLALLHIGIVHLATVIFSPHALPVSRGMFTGETSETQLAHDHGKMLHEVAAQVGIATEAPHA